MKIRITGTPDRVELFIARVEIITGTQCNYISKPYKQTRKVGMRSIPAPLYKLALVVFAVFKRERKVAKIEKNHGKSRGFYGYEVIN